MNEFWIQGKPSEKSPALACQPACPLVGIEGTAKFGWTLAVLGVIVVAVQFDSLKNGIWLSVHPSQWTWMAMRYHLVMLLFVPIFAWFAADWWVQKRTFLELQPPYLVQSGPFSSRYLRLDQLQAVDLHEETVGFVYNLILRFTFVKRHLILSSAGGVEKFPVRDNARYFLDTLAKRCPHVQTAYLTT